MSHLSHRELFFRYLAQTSPEPLALEPARAEGVWIEDTAGKRYLDLISGIAVSSVGHRAPEVLAAMQAQMDRYLHTMVYGEHVQGPQVELAAAVCASLGAHFDNVYFVNSGSEAVEGALKLAKKATGRSGIIAFENSYHGGTHGALSVTGSPALKAGYGPLLPDVQHLPWGRIPALEAITRSTACVIVEPVQGEAGVRMPPAGFLEALRARCTETGTLLIADEIQTGMGRTGSLWAWQQCGMVPDIVVMAKGMGGGMPIGAFAAPQALMRVFTHAPVLGHITTFGGHPVSCAAALATLHKVQAENLPARALALEQRIRAGLQHPAILEIRGRGLMLAAETGDFDFTLRTCAQAVQQGLLTDWFLHCGTALRIAPPLTLTDAEADLACARLCAALDAALPT